MPGSPQRFTVSAHCGDGPRAATRCNPASTMVLADRWAAAGCRDVAVEDPNGTRYDRDTFRLTLPLVRKRERPAI